MEYKTITTILNLLKVPARLSIFQRNIGKLSIIFVINHPNGSSTLWKRFVYHEPYFSRDSWECGEKDMYYVDPDAEVGTFCLISLTLSFFFLLYSYILVTILVHSYIKPV